MAGLVKTRTAGVYKAQRAKGTVFIPPRREVEPVTGKGRVRDKAFPTEAAARDFLIKTKHAQATGTYVDPNQGKVTFREVAEQWLTIAATQVRPRTLENYERSLRCGCCPRSARVRSPASQAGTWRSGSRTWATCCRAPSSTRSSRSPGH